jgi:hypothetical protein
MTDKEVMQMALDALNNFDKGNHGMRWQVPIIKTLREALLAQPEPAECDGGTCGIGGYCDECPKTQPEPEPVAWMYVNTDGECEQIEYGEPFDDPSVTPLYAALPQRKEWHHPDCEGECIACLIEREVQNAYGNQGVDYLRRHVTAPPQREWVVLTDEEISEIWSIIEMQNDDMHELKKFARTIEAKLKEKNT